MTSPLSDFRDIVQLIHRVVRPDALHSHDLRVLIDKIHDVLSTSPGCDCEPIVIKAEPFRDLLRPPTPPTLVIHADQEVGEVVPNVVVTKEEPEVREVRNLVVNLPAVVQAVKLEAPCAGPPASDSAILKDLARDEEDVDDEPDVSDVESVPESVPIDDDDAASEAESAENESDGDASDDEEEQDEEEAAEEAAEEEEEEEEDDDLQLLKIKKQRYYWSPSSKRIYEYLEEGYGDCIGTYEDGKIIPKA